MQIHNCRRNFQVKNSDMGRNSENTAKAEPKVKDKKLSKLSGKKNRGHVGNVKIASCPFYMKSFIGCAGIKSGASKKLEK